MNLIQNILEGKSTEVSEEITGKLYELANQALEERKAEIAVSLFSDNTDLDEAKRLISIHGAEGDRHTAKVYKEDGEYQVHFFKNGQHMGEDAVYHTDDKHDAVGTADSELKRLKEEVEQIEELSKNTLQGYVRKAIVDKNKKEFNQSQTRRDYVRSPNEKALQDKLKAVRKRREGIALAQKKVNQKIDNEQNS